MELSFPVSKNATIASSSLPDFNDRYMKYTKQLLRGRHPRSFPRNTELWHHFEASTNRLERVTKGHDIWNVVDKSKNAVDDQEHVNATSSDQIQEESEKNISYLQTHAKNQTDFFHRVTVDLKSKVRMHYTMPVVVVNNLGQYLCVNDTDEIQCKPPQLLLEQDKICFKLLDLTDPLNPGPVKYGSPLWLQVVDTQAEDHSWQAGSVVAVKLFGPPEMQSIPLEQVGSRESGGNRNEHVHNGSHTSQTNSRLKDRKEDNSAGKGGSAGEPRLLPRVSSSTGPADARTTSPNRRDDGDGRTAKKKLFEEAQICGGVKPAKIAAGNWTKESVERFMKSKQSSQLGQFVAHCALRTPDTEDSVYLNSRVAVVMEQDLYCLATSHGSGYLPWPRNVANVMQSSSSNLDSAKTTGSLTEEGVLADGTDYACLRRVVMRGLPYEHIVDRRCVWHFYVVDSAGDFKSMSVKEQRAQKLLKKARKGLNRSRRLRQGGHVHTGHSLDGKPLVSGEKFSHMLREMVTQTTQKLEFESMEHRRRKEERIAEHFHNLYRHCVHKINDDISTGDDDIVEDPIAVPAASSESVVSSDNSAAVLGSSSINPTSSSSDHHRQRSSFRSDAILGSMERSVLHSNATGAAISTGTGAGTPLSSQSGHTLQHSVGGEGGGGGSVRSHHSHSHGHGHSHGHHYWKAHSTPGTTHSSVDLGRVETAPPHSMVVALRARESEGDLLLTTHEQFARGRQHAQTQLQISRASNNRAQELPPINQARLEELLEMDEMVQQALKYRSRVHQFQQISAVVFDGDGPSSAASLDDDDSETKGR